MDMKTYKTAESVCAGQVPEFGYCFLALNPPRHAHRVLLYKLVVYYGSFMRTAAWGFVCKFSYSNGVLTRRMQIGGENVAKDGTNRGGPRPGTGPKRKSLVDKIQDGTAKGTLVMPDDLPEPADIRGEDVPPVRDYLKAKQKNGSDLCAEEIFRETWLWLKVAGLTKAHQIAFPMIAAL